MSSGTLTLDVVWQINSRGKFLAEEHLDNTSYQFVTIAGDGLCLFWDLRYKVGRT
jgi:hypothetical protein